MGGPLMVLGFHQTIEGLGASWDGGDSPQNLDQGIGCLHFPKKRAKLVSNIQRKSPGKFFWVFWTWGLDVQTRDLFEMLRRRRRRVRPSLFHVGCWW